MLLEKFKVKEDKLEEYLKIADKTDKGVEAHESGMLHHAFAQDPDEPIRFVLPDILKMMMLYLLIWLIHQH